MTNINKGNNKEAELLKAITEAVAMSEYIIIRERIEMGRLAKLSKEQVKAILAGFYLFDIEPKQLCKLYNITGRNLEMILEEVVFKDASEEFFREHDEQLDKKVADAMEAIFGLSEAEPKQEESMRDYIQSLIDKGLSREEIAIKQMEKTLADAEAKAMAKGK